MAVATSSMLSGTLVYDRSSNSHIRTYNWPPLQLNFWIIVMLLCATSIIGVFSIFLQTQNQLSLPIPWYFPYFITVAALAIVFIVGIFWLIANRRLLPAIVMIGAFMLFVMWLVGLVIVAIEVFGTGGVQTMCDNEVFSRNPTGQSEATLAWMQQRNICQSWQLVFSMALIGGLFLIWIMVMAYQVFANS